jgi:putative CocE/NonD family hydrolase
LIKNIFFSFLVFFQFTILIAQDNKSIKSYTKESYMIPMRDGIMLYTEILKPIGNTESFPFLIKRTPYGSETPFKIGDSIKNNNVPAPKRLAEGGYIFVLQDVRGKSKSEGVFEIAKPLYHLKDSSKTDESTDAYDTVDWLVKNISNNNGKAGIYGISYPGLTSLQASVNSHPALKTSSPQASPADMFLGDDFHHNGAFRLSYAFEYAYLVEKNKESLSLFPFPQYDVFDWYLKLGGLSNVNEKYFKNKFPSWNDFVKHPNYDDYWKQQSSLTNIHAPEIPILHVGGYFDPEDLMGPQVMYEHLEKKDASNKNYMILGPWNHGQWSGKNGNALGKIQFGSNTSEWFQDYEKKWFDYWLKNIGDGKFNEVHSFQTGTNQWQSYDSWTPKNVTIKRLYTHSDNTVSFNKPTLETGSVSYISDPLKPIPYRKRPIESTFSEDSNWSSWHVEDQRFVSSRPDVLNFKTETLLKNITVTGKVKAHINASTTATDADFIVKIIDVYPDFYEKDKTMSGYQLPVTMEVFRGRFRKSFENPEPFTPNKSEEIIIDLHQINHVFLKGHKIMIQIQSTWFPIIDRNPQKYVPNIFKAKDSDFTKATHTIFCNSKNATYIELPIVEE